MARKKKKSEIERLKTKVSNLQFKVYQLKGELDAAYKTQFHFFQMQDEVKKISSSMVSVNFCLIELEKEVKKWHVKNRG